MDLVFATVVLVVLVAIAFDYINGFHDTANAIATVVSTGVLPIRTAVLVAALLNFGGAFLGTAVLWIVRSAHPTRLNGIFRRLQIVSAGFMALSHGSNDAQKTMGIITMSLVAYGAVQKHGDKLPIPLWVIMVCAAAMAAGTAA